MPDSLTALSGATRVAGLIGEPTQVHFSRSPAIHNAAFRALALDWVYVGFPVEEGHAPEAIRGLRAAGVSGLNVTNPHKVPAASAMDRLEGTALVLGAVNTIEMREGELVGWNTDGDGLVRFVVEDAGATLEGAAAVVLGAGGTARSVVAALAAAGVASITLVARDPLRGEALRPLAATLPFVVVAWDAVPVGLAARADLLVNATPVGQAGEEVPIVPEGIRPGAVVLDVVYHPPETRLVREARERGANAFGGLGMLVRQAALSFEIWTRRPAPLDAMWAAAKGEEVVGG